MSFTYKLSNRHRVKGKREYRMCLWTHVQNESNIITRMLESCVRHIDYWVIVDNGSTDGTQQLVVDFFKKAGIEGVLYENPNGWITPGTNRQYAWDRLNETNHKCDWIIRVDADEGLYIDDDFDHNLLNIDNNGDKLVAYNVPYVCNGNYLRRMWLYRWGLKWSWKSDSRAHETIQLNDYEDIIGQGYIIGNLPLSFRHREHGRGSSSGDILKYMKDSNNLEMQCIQEHMRNKDVVDLKYHLYYVGMSYNYNSGEVWREDCYKHLPMGVEQLRMYNRRGIDYWTVFMGKFGESYDVYYNRGELYRFNMDYDLAIRDYYRSYECSMVVGGQCEGLVWAAFMSGNMGRYDVAYGYMEKSLSIECPLRRNDMNMSNVHIDFYYDTGTWYYMIWRDICLGISDINRKKFARDIIVKGLQYSTIDPSENEGRLHKLNEYLQVCDNHLRTLGKV